MTLPLCPALFPWFTLVVAIAKNNLTNYAAAALTQLFCGKAVSEREVGRKLTEVYKLARSSCLLDASLRFRPRELDGRFPKSKQLHCHSLSQQQGRMERYNRGLRQIGTAV